MVKFVPFVTAEDDDDLVVSFGLGQNAGTSLTLIRSPQYEPLLSDEDRGVSVNGDGQGSAERELLILVVWDRMRVSVRSTAREYVLDISAVDPFEISEAKRVLQKMNFDSRFEMRDG